MDLIEKSKQKLKGFFSFKGFGIYIYNLETMASEIIPLPKIPPILRIKSSQELIALGKPTMTLEGKQVFFMVRGLPYSIESKIEPQKITDDDIKYLKSIGLTKNQLDTMTERFFFTMKGFSASDIDAKLNSIYIQKLTRPNKLIFTNIMIILLIMFSTSITTFLITYFYMNSI